MSAVSRQHDDDSTHSVHHGPIISAGILLGTGFGGFFDGILLHQILQWHNMLSSVSPALILGTSCSRISGAQEPTPFGRKVAGAWLAGDDRFWTS